MKKFIAVLASASVACTMLAFAGCGESGNEGVIKGNYKEPNIEQLNEALSSIDLESSVSGGIELSAKFEGGLKMDGMSVNGSVGFGYKLTADDSGVKGAGTASLSYSCAMTENNTQAELSGEYSAAVYNDSSYAYLALDGISDETFKAKVDYTELMEFAMGQLPVSLAAASTGIDATEIVSILNACFIEVGLDTSNGVKLKFSASEDTVWALLVQSGEFPATAIPELKKYISFSSFKLDEYMAFDKEGAFVASSLDLDIGVKLSKEISSEVKSDITANIKGYYSLKAYAGTVDLPADIATDVSYIDLTDVIIDAIEGEENDNDNNNGNDYDYDIDVAGKTYVFTEVTCISLLGEEEENTLIAGMTAARRNTALEYTLDGKCYWYSYDNPILSESQMVYYWQEDESVYEVRNKNDLYNYDKIEGYSFIEYDGRYLVEYIDVTLSQNKSATLKVYYEYLPL